MHEIEEEWTNKNHSDMENINSISFNNKQFIIVAKLNTSSSQTSAINDNINNWHRQW